MKFNFTSRVYDMMATISAGGVMAVSLTDLDLVIKIVVGMLTSIFLVLGIIVRTKELRACFCKRAEDEGDSGDGGDSGA